MYKVKVPMDCSLKLENKRQRKILNSRLMWEVENL